MNLLNKLIRKKARSLLDDNVFGKDWLKSVLILAISAGISYAIISVAVAVTSLIVSLISSLLIAILPDANKLLISIISWLITFLVEAVLTMGVSGNMEIGIASVNLDLVRNEGYIQQEFLNVTVHTKPEANIRFTKFLKSFKNFSENFMLGFMVALQIFLWSLLFVVPGIYVALSYALVYHVKNDHPEYTWRDCLDESERLMTGNRWRFFKLIFGFLGWIIVGALAFFGIGALWPLAHMNTSIAVFYEQVRSEKEEGAKNFGDDSSTNPVVVYFRY